MFLLLDCCPCCCTCCSSWPASETPKHHATEGRNDLQKHAAPGLDVLSGFYKQQCGFSCWVCCSTAGPAVPVAVYTWHAPETLEHHATEGRNDLQKHAAPRLDVHSGSYWKQDELSSAARPDVPTAGLLSLLLYLLFLLTRLRNTKTPCHWRTERPPKTRCPGAWRPFWILQTTMRVQLLGVLFYCWACCSCCCIYLTRPRNTRTPCHWRTERPPKTRCPEAWRPFWILLKTRRVEFSC